MPTSFTCAWVAILMAFMAAVLFGLLSYGRLPITLMPELSYPTLTVRTEYAGAAPEEVETLVTIPIDYRENALLSERLGEIEIDL